MHSYQGKQGTIFHHNSDFSGNVIITHEGKEIEIPGSDILELVAYEYILPQKISAVEQAGWQELLSAQRGISIIQSLNFVLE